MKKDESEETPKTQPDKTVTVHELVDDGNGGSRPKKRVTPVHPSRVERSRLSLITFLNNITAPPIRMEANNSSASSGKTRSQSISISSPAHSQIASATTATDESAAASFPPVQACDKLSIKSGVSMAASSNSGPSESMFSAGSGTSLSCSKASSKHRECPICCVRQSAGNFQKLKCCPHLACKSCLIKYLTTEIMESRTNISCPECPAQLHASDIYALLSHQPELIDRFELFALRRALSTDPDTRWCPAPDCIYAVIAQSCAACPQLKCERCSTMFCYHCKNTWHPSQTCDQARSKVFFNNHPPRTSPPNESTENDVMKACPRCGALIMKMNDGSCNHMQCALCNAEFCWLCLKQINELHYLSPTGCTFWGKKPWTRKKKLLWQIGTLIGAPLGIALIAGLAVPGIICGVPIFVGRKTYQRFSNLTRTKRQLVTAMSVVGSLLVSPVLAVMAVGVGVPIMLAYVYGVVPLSLCRNGACGGSNGGDGGNGDDEEVAYGEEVMAMNPDTNLDVGLLVLRGNNELIRRKLRRVLELAVTKVRRKLYVHVEEKDGGFRELLPAIYLNAASIRSELDLRVLIDKPTITVDRIFYDEVKDPDQPAFPMLKDALATGPVELGIFAPEKKPYEHVVMGGTFDRLHNGHKVLLSEAIMLARGKITCGITDGDMNKKKILYELIEPIEKRCTEVEHFVRDVSGTVQCSAVKITDAYGPSTVGNDFQAIVVSEETVKGGNAVNARRKELGLNELVVHVVKLLEGSEDKVLNEVKLSSSVVRRQLLGQILKEPNKIDREITGNHYVIGLTGGIASGKTHIAKYLAAQGCEVIECDILVHQMYAESAELRNQLVEEFGPTILWNGTINRIQLSDLVFKDKVKLEKLNSIVWPLVAARIAEIVRNSTKEIVVVDAALLLEAGWEKFLHQIWTVFVPREEAIKRICARDKVPVERASERLDHQLGNAERIGRSHAVFCSLWDYSETERQVQKALDKVKTDYISKSGQ